MPDLVFTVSLLIVLSVLLWVAGRYMGFMGQKPADYAAEEPAIDIRHHLSGPILCEGVIYGPMGRVTSRFVAQMDGKWEGNRGILNEHFRYAAGNAQDRQWRLQLSNDGSIRAEADDIVGTGTGHQAGSAVRLQYRIRLPDHAGGWSLDVTDWMYLTENGTVMNRSQFRKFGIKVAELVATMRRVNA
jgi:hypothetical protein